jgi:hypothetical protein
MVIHPFLAAQGRTLTLILSLVLTICTTVTAHQLPIEVTFKLVSNTPLPLQAARIRAEARRFEAGTQQIPFLFERDFGFLYQEFQSPDQKEWDPLLGRVNRFRRLVGIQSPVFRDKWTLMLKAGQSIRSSNAAGATWGQLKGVEGAPRFTPLFKSPGHYQFTFMDDGHTHAKFQVDVDVAIPNGSDKEVWKMMQHDRQLTAVMLSTAICADRDGMELLESIVQDHGKASYADYARFALARSWAKNDLTWETRDRKKIAEYVKRRLAMTTDPKSSKLENLEHFFGHVVCDLQGKEFQAANAAVETLAEGGIAFDQAMEQFIDCFWASDADLLQAETILKEIQDPGFAYYPSTLILLKDIYHALGRVKDETAVQARLDRDFSDDREWLSWVHKRHVTPHEWCKFRIRSLDRGPTEVEDPIAEKSPFGD